jgi:adenylate cyclase class IV
MEIEIKALLTEEQYNELRAILNNRYEKIEEDEITTFRFRPHDVRVRFSHKINELIYKSDDPTTHSREEITVNLAGREDALRAMEILHALGFKPDPSWLKRKEEFLYKYNDYEYTISLQYIERFAWLLEAEIIADANQELHIRNLKHILSSLGCEPIDPEDFKKRIQQYIVKNQ